MPVKKKQPKADKAPKIVRFFRINYPQAMWVEMSDGTLRLTRDGGKTLLSTILDPATVKSYLLQKSMVECRQDGSPV